MVACISPQPSAIHSLPSYQLPTTCDTTYGYLYYSGTALVNTAEIWLKLHFTFHRCATTWSQLWSSFIGCRLSKELHTSCVCLCITSMLDEHHSTYQIVYPQSLHSVADTGWGRLAQRITFCQEQEPNLENEASFSYCGPAAWNTLPSDLHDIKDTDTFRKRLKSVLFDRAYHQLLLALLDVSYSGALQILRWLIDWSEPKVSCQILSSLPCLFTLSFVL